MTQGQAFRLHAYTLAVWLTAMLLALPWQAQAQAKRIDRMQAILSQEIRFTAFDKLALRDAEPCPAWVDADGGPRCRRLDVVYRNVYLSGILIEHPNPASTLALYHSGHEASRPVSSVLRDVPLDYILGDGAWLTSQMYGRGADVLILTMPGLGLAPSGESDQVSRLYSIVKNHNAFALLDFQGDSAAAYFVAHVKGFLDRFSTRYRNVIMAGRSGGGWATTIAAAVDRRIKCSVSFFGSLPMQLRLPVEGDETDDLGDFEQFGLSIYQRIDYADFYALATTRGRNHVLVYNERDDCCFSGAVKGRMVMPLLERLYPQQRGVSVSVLPHRSDTDHYNLDASALSTIESACGLRPTE